MWFAWRDAPLECIRRKHAFHQESGRDHSGNGQNQPHQGKAGTNKADTGAVYRALQQLELDGEVESNWDTSIPGPARKIYKLTPVGWEKLDHWKEDIELRLKNLTFFLTTYKRVKNSRNGW